QISQDPFSAAAIQVNFAPTQAANATWQLDPTDTAKKGGVQLSLTPGNYTVYFSAVPGFLTPPPYPVTLVGGNLSNITRTYFGILTQPSNKTVSVGSSATFTVGVSGEPTSYQWRKDGVNITGATSASYTKTNVSLADSGSKYSVVVTWGTEGSQTSSSATL